MRWQQAKVWWTTDVEGKETFFLLFFFFSRRGCNKGTKNGTNAFCLFVCFHESPLLGFPHLLYGNMDTSIRDTYFWSRQIFLGFALHTSVALAKQSKESHQLEEQNLSVLYTESLQLFTGFNIVLAALLQVRQFKVLQEPRLSLLFCYYLFRVKQYFSFCLQKW